MTVILVLATFLVFIVIDFFLSRKSAAQIPVVEESPRPAPLLSATSVEGILVPDQMRYHPGHTWILEERPGVARVGADALAVRVLGRVDKIELPKAGRWVRQGQKAFTFWTGSEKVELVSPVEGEVVEVNSDAAKDPSILANDPYGRGWLIKVNVPERETVGRNLLPQALVKSWMREEVRRVRAVQPELAAVMVAGGGQDASFRRGKTWSALTRELFLG
jgi:glycine cleavage system H protein